MRKPKNACADIRTAAVRACSALLATLDRHDPAQHYILRRALNELVWCYSGNHEDAGKYLGCPKWTVGALAQLDSGDPDWAKGVALEHVVERKAIITRLLITQIEAEVREVLETADTCVVLRSEHDALASGDGWERYKGIQMVAGPRARLRTISSAEAVSPDCLDITNDAPQTVIQNHAPERSERG